RAGRSREGTGRRTSPPWMPDGSGENATVRPGFRAIARVAAPVSWRKISIGGSGRATDARAALIAPLLGSTLEQLGAEAALVVFGDHRPLDLVALVQERGAERERDVVVEDL